MKRIAAGDRRLVITKNLIMMLVMLVVIFVAIFAWYSNNDTVTASGTTVSAKSADNVELALPNDDGSFPISNDAWSTELDFAESPYCLKDLVKDITSGGRQFVVPTFAAAKGLKDGRTVITDDVWTEGLSSREALTNSSTLDDDQYNYFSFDFYIRSKQKKINITAGSFLAAGSELGINADGQIDDPPVTKQLKGTNIYRHSSYGKAENDSEAFSSDAIVGAMRVSLVGAPVNTVNASSGEETVGTNTLKFLWLPRPDVHLNTSDNSDDWTLTTGITNSHELADETYCHSFYVGKTVEGTSVKKGLTHNIYYDDAAYTPSDTTGMTSPDYFYVSNGTTNLSTNISCPSLGRSAEVANNAPDTSAQIQFTQGNNNITGYYVYKYTLNIWIEGEDAEARRSMNNGVFSLELDFGT